MARRIIRSYDPDECAAESDDWDIPEERVHGTPHRAKLKWWYVLDSEGNEHLVQAHYCFNNGDEGLIFRMRRRPSDEYTAVVAHWAHGAWKFYKETNEDGQ